MRILLVDDEEDVRSIATLSLARVGGMDVRTASGGKEALAIAEAAQPDAILMDRMMPDMDGRTTLLELRKIEAMRDVPVIFLTATALSSDVEELMAIGAVGVIAKPFNPMTLPAQVKRILERD